MIETFVTYVSAQTRLNVFRIEATAIMIGISTAGSVPKTKKGSRASRRRRSAPRSARSGPEPPPDESA